MAKWSQTKLGQISQIYSGFAFRSQDLGDHGIPVLKIANIQNKRVSPECPDHFPEELYTDKLNRFLLHPDDTLIAMTGAGSVGKVGKMPRNPGRFLVNQRVAIVRPDSSTCDPAFVYFALSQDHYEKQLYGLGLGAGQPNVSGKQIGELELPFPPLPVQRRIAGILSAYDELIENCQRRIRILESMARALYREWFVHFRFLDFAKPSSGTPGRDFSASQPNETTSGRSAGVSADHGANQTHPRVASPLGHIPKGWEVKEMQEVADVIDCLHSKKPSECADGPGVLLQLNNIGEGGKLDMRELFRISAEDYRHWTSRIELCAGDCVVTNVGRVGAVAQIPEGVKAAPGRNMTAIRVRSDKLTPTFLIEYLLSSHMESEVAKKKDLGTIMDSLNVKGIIRLHVPCPPFAAMEHFETVARPIRKRIELLVEQIQNLRRTRDLLLPRLLSGQVNLKEN